jgi:hypothetical protein
MGLQSGSSSLHFRIYLKHSNTQKRKINTAMRLWERINLTIKVDKQMRNRKYSNITKIIK